MLGSAVFRTGVAPGGALAGPWVRNPLWAAARAVPSLDLRFAENKSLVDATTGQNLVTFTRASSGTYVDSQGVIRTATTNLLTFSEDFGNVAWTNSRTTLTANTATAPNGQLTAGTATNDTTAGNHSFASRNNYVITANTVHTYSVYLKQNGSRYVVIRVNNGADTDGASVCADLNLGTITAVTQNGTAIGSTASISNAGNSWYRVSLSVLVDAASTTMDIRHFINQNYSATLDSYTGSLTESVFIWGAQLEQSATVGEYIPTTSTINSAPRFDHNPTTGESLGLLVEEQRTNLLSASEEMVTAPWGLAAATGVANNGIAPDGTTTADKIISTGGGCFRAGAGVVNATAYTYSVFLKHVTGTGVVTQVGFERFGSTPLLASISVNLLTGTITNNGAPVTSSSITRYSNNWYRVSITATSTDVTTTLVNYTSTSGNEFLIWGAQLEAGSFPTSYIPTTTAAATRSADVASITGSNFSSWYRQDEGTVFSEFALNGVASQNKVVNVDAGSGYPNSIDIYCVAGIPRFEVWVGSVAQAQLSTLPSVSVGTSVLTKTAGTYKTNDFAATRSGGAIITDSSGILPSTTRLIIGFQASSNYLNGTIRRLTFWPQRLPDTTLQQITQ